MIFAAQQLDEGFDFHRSLSKMKLIMDKSDCVIVNLEIAIGAIWV